VRFHGTAAGREEEGCWDCVRGAARFGVADRACFGEEARCAVSLEVTLGRSFERPVVLRFWDRVVWRGDVYLARHGGSLLAH
jgi:hypothetical protein